jgi:hypothetical protein
LQSESPQETAMHMESWEKLAAYYQQEQSLIRDQLCKPGIFFESQIYGLDTFIDAMDRFGYISSERVRAHLSQQQK